MNIKDELRDFIDKNKNTYARYMQKSKPELFALIAPYFGRNVAEKCFNYFTNNSYVNFTNCEVCKKETLEFQNGEYNKYCSNKCSNGEPLTRKKNVRN